MKQQDRLRIEVVGEESYAPPTLHRELNALNDDDDRMHRLNPGVKINGTYYRDVVLRQMLLPGIRSASVSEFFVFFPAELYPITSRLKAKHTVSLLDQETPDLIPPAIWPPNLLDLSLPRWLHRVECASIASLSCQDLGRRRTEATPFNSEWAALSHTVSECAFSEWRQHLRARVRAGGGHLERTL